MFGRSSDALLKAAEAALANDLLDAAFEAVTSPDAGDGRRRRKLLTQLSDALMRRGQDHLLGRRFAEAVADFERAGRCGHPAEKVLEWQQRARDAQRHHQDVARRQDAAVAQARDRLAAGSIAGAHQARDSAPIENSEIHALAEAIHSQVQRAETALAAARSALREDDAATAVQQYRIARTLHSRLDGLAELETAIYEKVVQEATQDYRAGRLSRVRQRLRMLDDVGRGRSVRVELEEAVRLADAAAKALAADHFSQAGVLLGRLMQLGLEANWTDDVRERLRLLEESRRALLEGPLGLLCEAAGMEAAQPRDRTVIAQRGGRYDETRSVLPATAEREAHLRAASSQELGILPRRILLRIDGAGSFLLLRGDRIGIGRAGSQKAELELLSDLSDRHAEIVRAGEDYFVVCSQGVELAGRSVDHALLQDGDRIRLGNRVRLAFRRPSRKSVAALLELGEGVRAAAGDCRRVLLWDGPLLMGSSRECHIPLSAAMGGFVLHERAGQLFVRTMGPTGEAYHLPLGTLTTIGGMRLSANGYTGGSSVGRVIG